MMKLIVQLACVKHAASVRPEPGSNSRKKYFSNLTICKKLFWFQIYFWIVALPSNYGIANGYWLLPFVNSFELTGSSLI